MENSNFGNVTRNDKQLPRLANKVADIAAAMEQNCSIVGIGASAGGLQALLQLFENMSEMTGMAFVVIQHLDAQNESALAGILAKITRMAVSEVVNHTVASPNHIYVIAPGTKLTIAHGVLAVGPQKSGVGRYNPIDTFLESLTAYKGSKAIGVILSGNGADGSRGLKEIKAAGGFTFAQEPQSAEYKGMPLNAIATGMVDSVLTPPEIAGEILRLSRLQMIATPIPEPDELFPDGAEVLDGIIGLLRKVSGINFSEYKQLTIKRRIFRRMVLHKMEKLGDYAAYLGQNGAELAALQQDMLINVTKFFRDSQAFDALKTMTFPSIVSKTAPHTPLRLWVPGCATGEEAYSLAIALLEFLEDNALNRSIQIFATDINETVIDKARAGVYPKSIMTDVSPARLSRFFVEVEQGWQVSKSIRDICVFARQDIGQDPPISKVDIISCRNVMIYFGPALHKRMFPLFHYSLKPDGFLILGASESIGVFADLFDLVDKKYRIYVKKSVATPLISEFSSNEHGASVQNNVKDDQGSPSGMVWQDIQKEADRIVVNKYAPPGVIINSKLDIIQYRGRTGAYLEPASGMPSVNLLKMARDGLFLALRSAVSQARKENTLVRKEGLHVLKNGHYLPVNIDVVPINGALQKGEYFLVLFKEAYSQHRPENKPDGGITAEQEFHQAEDPGDLLGLKQEIAATKEYLQSIIDQHEGANEDLRYANEEVQSSNEELQSMNEELETAKEELQSTNEELMTLNEELRTRNGELSQVNDDMLNLLRSISIPVLILSSDLRIRRFNSIAEKAFNLISTDVGRPINNIKPNIDIPDLEQASLKVIDTLISMEQEVQDRWGQWYSMQIRPYKTTDNKIDGVIISCADINTVKKSLEAAQDAREYAEAIVETVRHPLLVLDGDLRLRTANKAFYQTFRLAHEDMVSQSIFQIKDGQWDIPELRTLLTDILEHDTAFEGFAINCDFPDIGRRTMLINARRIVNAHNKTKWILLAFETIASQPGKPQ